MFTALQMSTTLLLRLKAELDGEILLDECFKALCPGGSITGAPKIEVMTAIRELENRDRGYFYGQHSLV